MNLSPIGWVGWVHSRILIGGARGSCLLVRRSWDRSPHRAEYYLPALFESGRCQYNVTGWDRSRGFPAMSICSVAARKTACSFSPATPTPKGCTQLPLARWQLYYRTGDNHTVNDIYALATRWTGHATTYSWRILLYLLNLCWNSALNPLPRPLYLYTVHISSSLYRRGAR